MDVTFRSAELARLCNSGELLTQRWGATVGCIVARRLCDLAAIDAEALDRLPGTRVGTLGSGQTELSCGRDVVIRGVVTPAPRPTASSTETDQIVITSVDVEGTEDR